MVNIRTLLARKPHPLQSTSHNSVFSLEAVPIPTIRKNIEEEWESVWWYGTKFIPTKTCFFSISISSSSDWSSCCFRRFFFAINSLSAFNFSSSFSISLQETKRSFNYRPDCKGHTLLLLTYMSVLCFRAGLHNTVPCPHTSSLILT